MKYYHVILLVSRDATKMLRDVFVPDEGSGETVGEGVGGVFPARQVQAKITLSNRILTLLLVCIYQFKYCFITDLFVTTFRGRGLPKNKITVYLETFSR